VRGCIIVRKFDWGHGVLIDCAITHVLPHLYFIYLTVLLLDRTFRIDERCAAKYGQNWEQYCARVPYRLIPGVW
jgi:7-dehydrocholesterol reductase